MRHTLRIHIPSYLLKFPQIHPSADQQQNGLYINVVAHVFEEAIQLHCCRLVIQAHLVFYNLPNFSCYFWWPPRRNAPCDNAHLLELLDEFGHQLGYTAPFPHITASQLHFIALGIKEEDTLLLAWAEHHSIYTLERKSVWTVAVDTLCKTTKIWKRNDLLLPVWVWDDNNGCVTQQFVP